MGSANPLGVLITNKRQIPFSQSFRDIEKGKMEDGHDPEKFVTAATSRS